VPNSYPASRCGCSVWRNMKNSNVKINITDSTDGAVLGTIDPAFGGTLDNIARQQGIPLKALLYVLLFAGLAKQEKGFDLMQAVQLLREHKVRSKKAFGLLTRLIPVKA